MHLEANLSRASSYKSGLCDISFLPLHTGTRAPSQDVEMRLDTEPVFVTTTAFKPSRKKGLGHGVEYISFYYVGQIPHDVVSFFFFLKILFELF
jgi:hypothetical protein